MDRLEQQMKFILEADKLKQIVRQSYIGGADRKETDAEHSWHLALMCALLSEYAAEKIDVAKTMVMVLIHDKKARTARCTPFPMPMTRRETRANGSGK